MEQICTFSIELGTYLSLSETSPTKLRIGKKQTFQIQQFRNGLIFDKEIVFKGFNFQNSPKEENEEKDENGEELYH